MRKQAQECLELMQKNKKLQAELDEISRDKKAYDKHRTEIEVLKDKILTLTAEKDTKHKKNEMLRKDNESLRKQLQQANEQIKITKEINKDLKDTIADLKAELKQKEKEMQEVQGQLGKAAASQGEHNQEIDGLRAELLILKK